MNDSARTSEVAVRDCQDGDEAATKGEGVVEKKKHGDGSRGGEPTHAWTTAALAHASALLTLALAFAGGVGALIGLVVPLVIYLSHRESSRFIAFHALQALVYQGVGILAYLGLVIVSALIITAAWTISGMLSAVVIGFLLMPLALLATVVVGIVLVSAPLAWVGYGLYAAYEVYQGNRFRYRLLGEWVEREVVL